MAGFDDLASPPTAAKAIAPAAPTPPAPVADKQPGTGVVEKMIAGFGSGVKEAAEKNRAIDAQTMKMSPPKLELPPKPEFQNTSPIDAWGSIAMVLAALASTRVRNHASTAMNAAAAAMKGIQDKDKEAYDRSFKEWEVATKNAIDLANFQQNAYNEMLHHSEDRERMNLDIGKSLDAAEEAKFKTLTAALQDPGMWQAYEKNGIAGAVDFQRTREKQIQEFEIRKLGMTATGQKAAQALLLDGVVKTDAWKNAKTREDKLNVLIDAGVDPTHTLLAMEKIDAQKMAEVGKDDRAGDALAEKKDEFGQTIGLKKDEFAEKKTEFGVREEDRKADRDVKEKDFDTRMKLERDRLEEKTKEDEARLEFYKLKLKEDTDAKHAVLEERAKEAFDKIALGKDTLNERVRKDVSDEDWRKYKLGETHEEYEERMALGRDRLDFDKEKDAARRIEFTEKMNLELQKFDEKRAVDEARITIAKDRLETAEKGKSVARMTEDEIEETAQEMAHLKIPLATDFLAARNPSWGAANRRAMEIAKAEGKSDFSAQWYPALLAQRKDAGSGQASKGIRYLSVANKHLEAMEAAVMALPNDTDIKGLTKVFNFVSNQVNDSDLAAEQVDGQIVANEVAKAISGAGNLTGEERDKLNSMFEASRGKASILNIIHHARELLGGQAGGYVKQFSHYGDAADVTGMDQNAAKSFFINPKTGDTDPALVQWDRARIAATLEGKPPPPMPGSEPAKPAAPAAGDWKFERAGEFNGKPVGVKDGKWVYEDGSPVEGQ